MRYNAIYITHSQGEFSMAYENDDLNLRRTQREKLRQERLAKQRKLKIIIAVTAALILVAGAALFFLLRGDEPAGDEPAGSTGEAAQTEAPETAAPDRVSVVRIAAAGDLCVTDRTVAAGGTEQDYTALFMDVLPLLADADLTVLNFEGNLVGAPYGTLRSSAPREMAQALAAAGVDLVQVANSKSIAGGLKGLKTTLDELRAAGLEPVGAFATNDEFDKTGGYTLRTVNGVKIAFVAFTKGMDNLSLPAGSENCVNVLYKDYASNYQKVDTDGITRILRNVAEEAPDVTVALLHWGSEYNELVSDSQKKILKLMKSEGVDVVLGTHSHLLQQMELGEDGTFVAYSLGDFLSDGERSGSNYSVVLELEITKNFTTGVTSVTDWSYSPIYNQNGMRLLRLEDAIAAYESDNIDRVSEEDYNNMVYAQDRVKKRIEPDSE